tara:strand:+ start:2967 stop:3446 length:480 start_codon:yes stop_codon:yes gene_type:complete
MDTNVEFKNDLKPDIDEAVSAFIERGFSIDEIISHGYIFELLGLPQPQGDMPYEQAKTLELAILDAKTRLFHRLLMDHDVAIRSVHGEGYTRVRPDEQVCWSLEAWRDRVAKENSKAKRRLKHINTTAFTSGDHKKQTDALAKVGQLSSLVRRSKKRDW